MVKRTGSLHRLEEWRKGRDGDASLRQVQEQRKNVGKVTKMEHKAPDDT